jgi:hypothetical protein
MTAADLFKVGLHMLTGPCIPTESLTFVA